MEDSKLKDGFDVYKGLQRPLIYKSFKGKFIYWAGGCVLFAFLTAVIISTVLDPVTGGVVLIIITLSGLLYINQKQKKGLHKKTLSSGTFVVSPQFRRTSNK